MLFGAMLEATTVVTTYSMTSLLMEVVLVVVIVMANLSDTNQGKYSHRFSKKSGRLSKNNGTKSDRETRNSHWHNSNRPKHGPTSWRETIITQCMTILVLLTPELFILGTIVQQQQQQRREKRIRNVNVIVNVNVNMRVPSQSSELLSMVTPVNTLRCLQQSEVSPFGPLTWSTLSQNSNNPLPELPSALTSSSGQQRRDIADCMTIQREQTRHPPVR